MIPRLWATQADFLNGVAAGGEEKRDALDNLYNLIVLGRMPWAEAATYFASLNPDHDGFYAGYNIVYEGDSNIAGALSTLKNDIEGLLKVNKSYRGTNCAVGGSRMGAIVLAARYNIVDALYSVTYYKNLVILHAGINDLLNSRTGVDIYNDIMTWGAARKAVGFKVIVCTTCPITTLSGAQETQRLDLNTRLRADPTAYCDALADISGDAILGDPALTGNTTYRRDGTHFTPTGYKMIATYIKTAIDSIV